jgi:predicted kinase
MKEPILTLMCGIPRVGKSTWIKENKGGACIVSPDDIRKEIFGHQFHSPANKFIFGIAESMAFLLLQQGKDVIIDATHITCNLRTVWRSIAIRSKAKTQVVWVYSHKDMTRNFCACLERNALSDPSNKLPLDALLRMADVFEEPYEEWYDLIEYKNPQWKDFPENKRIECNKDDDIYTIANKFTCKYGSI